MSGAQDICQGILNLYGLALHGGLGLMSCAQLKYIDIWVLNRDKASPTLLATPVIIFSSWVAQVIEHYKVCQLREQFIINVILLSFLSFHK